MKIVYTILPILFLFTAGKSYSMENSESNKSKFCPLFKQIKPDAPQEKYDELAALLKQNKLTTCACMKYFMDIKEKRALKGIKEQWHQTDETLNAAFTNAYTLGQSQPKANNNVQIDNRIPPSVQQKIIQKLVNVKAIAYDPNGANTCKLDPTFEGRKSKTGSSIELLKCTGFAVTINPDFLKLSSSAQYGALIHERAHIDHKDHLGLVALNFATQNKTPAFSFNIIDWITGTSLWKSSSFKKYARFAESRADRIPASCTNSNIARLLEELFLELPKIRAERGAIQGKDVHPSSAKRLAWATRIRKLMTAEWKLNNKQGRTSS